MSEEYNLLQSVFDMLWDTGKQVVDLSVKSYYDLSKKERPFEFKEYFEAVRLYKELKGVKTYPTLIKHVPTFEGEEYIFSVPLGIGKDYLNNFKDSLELAIGYDVKFDFKGSWWHIVVIKNKLKSMVSYRQHPRAKQGIEIYLGESLEGEVKINLKEAPNTFICGTTGSGKSVCTKSIITSLVTNYKPWELELYLCDLKRVELNLFKNLKHTKCFEYEVSQVTKVIQEIFNICEDRYTTLMKHNITSIFDYNKLFPNKKMTYKILYIEEIVLLLSDKSNTGMFFLKELLPICRACGVYVFITTQRPSADIIDSVAKANINNRISFAVEDEKNSLIAIDSPGAEKLKGNGHGILKQGRNKREFQGYYISDTLVKKLIEPYQIKHEQTYKSTPLGFKENKEDKITDLDFLNKI